MRTKLLVICFRRFVSPLWLGAALFCLAACEGTPDEPKPRVDPKTITAPFRVRVVHPTQGSGPNFLVKMYITEEERDSSLWYYVAKTDNEGVATFQPRLGDVIVDCFVPGTPAYYGTDTFTVILDDRRTHEFKLEAQ
jgi:hypothetical protein